MEIAVYICSEETLSDSTSIMEIRPPHPEEQPAINQIKIASQRARDISFTFFREIRVANLNKITSEYGDTPIIADAGKNIMWINESFLHKGVPHFTIDELTSVFLHEAAEYMRRVYPERFYKMMHDDPIFDQIIDCFPAITTNYRWYGEFVADIYSAKQMGECAITACKKMHRHVCEQHNIPYSEDYFQGSYSHPPLNIRSEVMRYYCQQKAGMYVTRMPLSPRKNSVEYVTSTSSSESETGKDGKQNYFEFVVRRSSNGFDFLQSLLELHPQLNIQPDWTVHISDEATDTKRKTQIKKFIHDVTTLMKLLLGSANLSVDKNGHFVTDNLPFGVVRANRGALSRTALGSTGSIRRIFGELKRCEISKPEIDEHRQKLQKLHFHIRCPSFEQQRNDVADLSEAVGHQPPTPIRR